VQSRDGETGVGAVIFDTQAGATAVLDAMIPSVPLKRCRSRAAPPNEVVLEV
jgi:hypothetical protein